MSNFETLGQSLLKFNIEKSVLNFFSAKLVQNKIIQTLQNRLFKEGLKKGDVSVSTDRGNPYTRFTESIKQSKGDPINRVTLADSGYLYDSMAVEIKKNQIALVADFNNSRYEGGIFKNFKLSFANKKDFRETVMSLTPKEIALIMKELISEIRTDLKKSI